MASTSKSWGITYQRRRSKREIEERRKAALIRRARYRDAAEVVRMLDAPGIGVNRRGRPSLQVCVFSWGQTDSQPAIFNTGGGVYLMSAFPTSSTEYQRHTNTTITYNLGQPKTKILHQPLLRIDPFVISSNHQPQLMISLSKSGIPFHMSGQQN